MASLLGTQDSMLNLIENLSFLPPDTEPPATSSKPAPTPRVSPPRVPVGLHTRPTGASYASASSTPLVATAAERTAAKVAAATHAVTAAKAAAATNASAVAAAIEAKKAALNVGGAAPAASTPRRVEATSVSIAKRPVPVIAWAKEPVISSPRTLAAAAVERNLAQLRGRSSAPTETHSKLAEFEGKFGSPKPLEEYTPNPTSPPP